MADAHEQWVILPDGTVRQADAFRPTGALVPSALQRASGGSIHPATWLALVAAVVALGCASLAYTLARVRAEQVGVVLMRTLRMPAPT